MEIKSLGRKQTHLFVSLVSILLIFGWVQSATAFENRVLVQPFTDSSGDSGLMALGEGFSDLLLATLATYDDIQVVDRENLHKIVRELGRHLSGLEKKDIKKIGKLLQANRFIKGGFVNVDGKLNVNVHVFDIESTQLLFSIEKAGDLKNVHELASKLGEEVAFKLINGKSLVNPALITERPEINLYYMKGLGAYYSGLYDHAVAEFMQVLDMDPSHANARYWLAKSYLEGGEKAHAKIELKRFLEEFPSDQRVNDIEKLLPNL